MRKNNKKPHSSCIYRPHTGKVLSMCVYYDTCSSCNMDLSTIKQKVNLSTDALVWGKCTYIGIRQAGWVHVVHPYWLWCLLDMFPFFWPFSLVVVFIGILWKGKQHYTKTTTSTYESFKWTVYTCITNSHKSWRSTAYYLMLETFKLPFL